MNWRLVTRTLFAAGVWTTAALAAEVNAVPNGSFETAAGGQPAGWSTHTWQGTAKFSYARLGRSGRRCVRISSERGADAAWFAVVPVQPHAVYKLSGWVKTDGVQVQGGRGALLNVHDVQSARTRALTGTNGWTYLEVVFDTGDRDRVQVNCLFGGWGLATGTAWYDDVQLTRLGGSDWKPRLQVDLTAPAGPAISPYIYGQFIEHLGRCIYGGIWAEMLEDRKFWFPITDEYHPYQVTRQMPPDTPFPVVAASPWQVTGPRGSVRMVRKDSFVGEHTPLVAGGSGIRQKDLGLVAGKDYVGYVWLKAVGRPARVQVTLTGADRPAVFPKVGTADYQKYTFRFCVGRSTDRGELEIRVDGAACLVGTVSLMPADNVQGMRADTLELLKKLGGTVYRWPGGNFVSGYDWRDGIGDRDRRPPRKNPAWTGVEHNDFGLDEFLTFCRLLDTEPYITVNSGLGDVEMAVQEVEYANGPADSPMGRLRAKNGHPKPYGVKFWSVGNEMYGNWQLGHMPLEEYVQKHNRFAAAMRAKDPSIRLIAVGHVGPWSEGMLTHCADHMDLISEHFYRKGLPGLVRHVRQMADAVRRIADAHRQYRRTIPALKGKNIRIALDEWNYWYGPYVFGELGTRYFLKDALGVAAALHEMARNSDLYYMANYAQTVNVIGCIKTTKTAATFAATALPLLVYRHHFGQLPVKVEADSPLDVAAALTADGKTLTVGVVNPLQQRLQLPLSVRGGKLKKGGRRWQVVGDDPLAYNEPGQPPRVRIEEAAVERAEVLTVEPCSVTLFALPLATR